MLDLKPRVAIIGAGNVGIRYAYALSMSGLARQIIIVDKNKTRCEGEVMDLSHGASYFAPVDIVAGDLNDIADSDLIVITAGAKQLPGQTRTDLAKENTAIFRKLIPTIVKQAPDAILLVVTNPVDVLSYATYKLSGKPAHQVIGSGTVLDSSRLRYRMAQHCTIDPHNIHAYILGEHGDSEFAAWSKAMIGGVLLKDYCGFCHKNSSCKHDAMLHDIFTEVKNAAYSIIKLKGETSYGIGLALVAITRAILKDEHAILPVSSLVDGYLGVRDVYMGLPNVVHKRGIREGIYIDLSKSEEADFLKSAHVIKSFIKECKI
ncbi:MAG: L-lactate dehydrogenase [bacterium]